MLTKRRRIGFGLGLASLAVVGLAALAMSGVAKVREAAARAD